MSMKKIILILILFIFTACSSQKLMNLDTVKEHLQQYYESGEYDNEIKVIIDDAIEKLSRVPINENSAVVFDIDETTLSNYEHIKEIGFGFVWSLWTDWMKEEDAKAIPQTKRLYDWLVERDVSIIFLTGRNEEVYEATLRNLAQQGFTELDTLITRSALTGKMSALVYKQRERKLLTEKGYQIIASVGDQWSDIEGGYTGLKVKVPNYFYIID